MAWVFDGICVNILRKKGEQTESTRRCAFTICPSAASDTSTRSPRHSDSWKPADRFVLKLFQHKLNCSSSAILDEHTNQYNFLYLLLLCALLQQKNSKENIQLNKLKFVKCKPNTAKPFVYNCQTTSKMQTRTEIIMKKTGKFFHACNKFV